MSFILITLKIILVVLVFFLVNFLIFWAIIQKCPIKKIVYYTFFNLMFRKDCVFDIVGNLLIITNKSKTVKCTLENWSVFKLVVDSTIIYATGLDASNKLLRTSNSVYTTEKMLKAVYELPAVLTKDLPNHFQV